MTGTNRKQAGFTLIEMMIVIGIIGILIGVLLGSVSYMRKTADRAKAQDLVSSAATALISILEKEQSWPGRLVAAAGGAQGGKLDENACRALVARNLFGLNHDASGKLVGNDRFGLLDPWAAAYVKRTSGASTGSRVASGGKIDDHILRFALDLDYDGFVEIQVGAGKKLKIRASAVVWSCGPDGEFADFSKIGRSDDVYSWQKGQVQ